MLQVFSLHLFIKRLILDAPIRIKGSFEIFTHIPHKRNNNSMQSSLDGPEDNLGHIIGWGREAKHQKGRVNVAGIIRNLAGMVAERIYLGQELDISGGRDDLDKAYYNTFGEDFSTVWVEKLFPGFFDLTEYLITANWAAVEAVAEGLLERKTLKQADVYQIIHSQEKEDG